MPGGQHGPQPPVEMDLCQGYPCDQGNNDPMNDPYPASSRFLACCVTATTDLLENLDMAVVFTLLISRPSLHLSPEVA